MEELILPVKGFECYYAISNTGKVYRINERREFVDNKILFFPVYEKLKLSKHRDDYLQVNLCVGGNQSRKLAHRLVAEAFIPNPNNYPQVNHKDGNKQNNNDWNLEWCNNSMNQLHLVHILGTHNTFGKRNGTAPKCLRINQIDKNTGELIKTWNSIAQAIDAKAATSQVWRALNDNSKTCGGFKWEYAAKTTFKND